MVRSWGATLGAHSNSMIHVPPCTGLNHAFTQKAFVAFSTPMRRRSPGRAALAVGMRPHHPIEPESLAPARLLVAACASYADHRTGRAAVAAVDVAVEGAGGEVVEPGADVADSAGGDDGVEELEGFGGGGEREDVFVAPQRMVVIEARQVGQIVEKPGAFK
jgi:hypothetical protein